METKTYLVLNRAGYRRTVTLWELKCVASSAQYKRKMRPNNPMDFDLGLTILLLNECGFTVEPIC